MPYWLTRLVLRMRATLSRRHDQDLKYELRLHLQFLEDDYRSRGLSPEDARAAAHRDFGNVTQLQETSHNLWSFRPLEDIVHDIAYSFREMRRSAGFTTIAVSSLALAIGAVIATFAVIDALLLRGLSVPEPHRLVAFSESNNQVWRRWSFAHYERWRSSSAGLFDVAASLAVDRFNVSTARDGRPETGKVRISLVSGNYFSVLQVPVTTGRALVEKDDRTIGGHPVAVISDAFWQRSFGRAPDILGRPIRLNNASYTVVGVTARGFTGEWIGQPTDAWIPLAMHAAVLPDAPNLFADQWGTGAQPLRLIARLRPTVTTAAAEASVNVVYQQFVSDRASVLGRGQQLANERRTHIDLVEATRGYSPERASYFGALMVLAAIVAVVLVVACANFANLLLGRSQIRQAEFLVRLALGAGRWRLVRQALTECAVLALLSGLFGLLAARWGTTALLKQLATTLQPVQFELQLDARVLGFAAACVVLVMLVGVWPATRGAFSVVTLSLVQRVSSLESRRRPPIAAGQMLLAGQLALCTILLMSAALFLQTVVNLRGQNLGFSRNVLLVSVAPAQAGYRERAAAMLIDRVRERLAVLPGIGGVSVSGSSLLNRATYWIDNSERLLIDQGTVAPGLRWTFSEVAPGFFRTVGMPLRLGRDFTDADVTTPPQQIVINRTLATFLFGEQNPLGRRIGTNMRTTDQEIIGVVDDGKQTSPRDQGLGIVYRPLRHDVGRVVLAIRTAGAPKDAAAMVRHEIQSVAAELPVLGIQSIEDQLDEAIGQERLIGHLASTLGIVAVLIACVGLHALLSYDVAQRTREIGVRLAIGATARDVVSLVLRDTIKPVAAALVIGLPIGVAATRPLTAQLYGVEPSDPATLAAVAFVLLLAAAVAAARPAHAAVNTDPVALLREP